MKDWIVKIIFLTLLISGCSGKEENRKAVIRPVKVITAESNSLVSKNFSGIVISGQFSNLTFKIPGTIIKFNVEEGSKIRKGTVIAELDPRDYELQRSADEAAYLTSKSNLERNRRLLTRQAISKQDMEVSEANFVKSKAAYENSMNMLADSRLIAPFNGFIELRYVENYQKVQPGEPVVKLVDPTILNVKFTIPERNVNLISMVEEITVRFEVDRQNVYKARIKEYVSASPDGSGIPVTLVIDDPSFEPQALNISPGFSCLINIRVNNTTETGIILPLSAVFQKNQPAQKAVWIYDASSGTVSSRNVTLGNLSGRDQILVTSGIKEGEKVVVAGVHMITNGQQVSLLEN
jgi:membrane fusion protein, multidrug efflux system